MSLGETVFYIIIVVIAFSFIAKLFQSTPEEKEYEKKLKASLEDEFIYDPETGAKITLEQAQSGHWIAHDNPNRIKSEEELNQFYDEREKEAEELVNHMKKCGYKFAKLTNEQISYLEKTKILEKYDYWSYSDSFSFNEGKDFVFFPAVRLNGDRHHKGFHESQIMFWIKDDDLSGHFYFREKSTFESFTDLLRNDDEIKLDDYESFAFEKSQNSIHLIKTLQLLVTEKDLEIEVKEGNLFIKTLQFPNMEDFLRVEKVVKKVYKL